MDETFLNCPNGQEEELQIAMICLLSCANESERRLPAPVEVRNSCAPKSLSCRGFPVSGGILVRAPHSGKIRDSTLETFGPPLYREGDRKLAVRPEFSAQRREPVHRPP